jgi:hypothetical protein
MGLFMHTLDVWFSVGRKVALLWRNVGYIALLLSRARDLVGDV